MSPDEAAAERRRVRRLFNRFAAPLRLLDPHLRREYARAVDRLGLDGGLSVLDLATGSGNLAGVLAARGCRVVGVDFAERSLARARRELPSARFVLMDLAELGGVRSRSFELVSIAYALHGMPEEQRGAVLTDAARLTRRWVLVLDYDGAGPFYVRFIEWLEGPHYPTFVAAPLASRLAHAGLEVVRHERTSRHGGAWLCRRLP